MSESELRKLPSVDAVVRALEDQNGARPRKQAAQAARDALEATRQEVADGGEAPALEVVVERAASRLDEALRPSLRRVINATGVILQTNLGRAPLSDRAMAAMAGVSAYSNLEYELEEGARGSRHEHVRAAIREATGAEDGIVVNNNASALLMVLMVFAQGREVIVSRGEAVEIGGGFRIPDVLRQSGAHLVEVGTTNRTYAGDYAAAITEETAALLKVHASNFRVVGFTAAANQAELAEVASRHGVLLIDDLGSGCLVDTTRYGMAPEPRVQDSLAAGVDLALFSGDKLLGGPQCGVIAGRTELANQLRRHPLARALRVDKLTIAALVATLRSYIEEVEEEEIPVWRMVSRPADAIRRRAQRWARVAGVDGQVVASQSMVGGGSLPGEGLETWCASIRPPAGVDALAERLRARPIPVIGRIEEGALLLDPRTVDPRDDRVVAAALAETLGS